MVQTLDPWLGYGSYWAEDIEVARMYGSGRHIFKVENPSGKKLVASDDLDLAKQLGQLGVPDAGDVVGELDWYELQEVRQALARHKVTWIVKPIDPSNSLQEREWIYVGNSSVSAELVHAFR